MIVDASAVLAILLDEPDRDVFARALTATTEDCVISPVNFLECCLKLDGEADRARSDRFEESLVLFGISVAEVTPEQARIARDAYRKFGKGRHPARLNMGDCFAYALAKSRGEPLLFKGNDFHHTDVEAAV